MAGVLALATLRSATFDPVPDRNGLRLTPAFDAELFGALAGAAAANGADGVVGAAGAIP
jgi:hypothetical protein